jgi:hypothetical protein
LRESNVFFASQPVTFISFGFLFKCDKKILLNSDLFNFRNHDIYWPIVGLPSVIQNLNFCWHLLTWNSLNRFCLSILVGLDWNLFWALIHNFLMTKFDIDQHLVTISLEFKSSGSNLSFGFLFVFFILVSRTSKLFDVAFLYKLCFLLFLSLRLWFCLWVNAGLTWIYFNHLNVSSFPILVLSIFFTNSGSFNIQTHDVHCQFICFSKKKIKTPIMTKQ